MSLTLKLTPGAVLSPSDTFTNDTLNALGNPTVELEGSISSASIADSAVTTTKLADGAVTTVKIADANVTKAKLAADAVSANVVGNSRNFLAQPNAGTPTTKIDLSADEVVVKMATGESLLVSGLSVTCDLSVNGAANRLDAGSLANTTWYYLWVISDGSTAGSLASTSATAPTMPSGFTYKALVGSFRTDGSAHVLPFYQLGRTVWIRETTAASTAQASLTSLSLATLVPPVAKVALGNAGVSASGNGPIEVASDANHLGSCMCGGQSGSGAVNGYAAAGAWRVPLATAQTVYYATVNGTAGVKVTVTGYEI